jgi:protein ImuB
MSARAVRSGPGRSGSLRPRPRSIEPIPLFPVGARQAGSAPHVEPRELWVGAHLPWLPLEALGASTGNAPRAIVELQGQTQYIAAVCERAGKLGVRPGMSMAAALALAPQLETRSREPEREQQLLEHLATRAQRFTPRVSLVSPDGLLLEVKGSLHLFGGAEALCRAIERECLAAGVKPILSLAPVPLAALAGARAGKSFIVTQPAHLMGHLASLPLATLRWPPEILQRLKQIGVYTIGEALRLPRGGFARRFGKAQLTTLDRVAGRDADLRANFQPRERFRRRHHLLHELEHHEAILATLDPVLQELGQFLKTRQCGITRLACLLQHRHASPTRCVLRLAAPAADIRHITRLLGERLATLTLPEPVRSCELRSGVLIPRAPVTDSLWKLGEHGGTSTAEVPELIEHLRARLGHEAVHGLKVLSSHRPETAWAATDLAAGSRREAPAAKPPWPAFRRPLWLLPVPQQLNEKDGLPRRAGALQLLGGPERIETGWWDGGDITRDYYVARDIHGVRLWIFRERSAPHRWFLHGVFG